MAAKVTGQLAYLAFLIDQKDQAFELAHRSLKMVKSTNDRSVSVNALMTLGEVALSTGDIIGSFQHFRHSLETIGIERRTGKTAHIAKRVDPRIIGGVIMIADGQIIDGSIRNQLAELRQNLLEARVN